MNQATHKTIRLLLDRSQEIREKAQEYRTIEEQLQATHALLNLNKQVYELVSEFIAQNTKFIEDSMFFLNSNLKKFTLNLPESIKKKKIRTIAADDHKLMLDKTVEILTPHFEVVGTAADGIAASEMIEALKPELAVLDISMPYKTGIEVSAELKERKSETKVVILTANNASCYREAALRAGALGFVDKMRAYTDLIPALEMACAGNIFISQQI